MQRLLDLAVPRDETTGEWKVAQTYHGVPYYSHFDMSRLLELMDHVQSIGMRFFSDRGAIGVCHSGHYMVIANSRHWLLSPRSTFGFFRDIINGERGELFYFEKKNLEGNYDIRPVDYPSDQAFHEAFLDMLLTMRVCPQPGRSSWYPPNRHIPIDQVDELLREELLGVLSCTGLPRDMCALIIVHVFIHENFFERRVELLVGLLATPQNGI